MGKKKFQEALEGAIELVESPEVSADGPWRIRGVGITADVVNGNGRRYPRAVLETAVAQAQAHLNESLGQGQLVLSGEPDHPSDKGNRRPLLMETVVNWDTINFDGKRTLVEGYLLGTSKGRDVRAMIQGGVKPRLSQRGNGDSKTVQENGRRVEVIESLTITGYDLVMAGSDPNGAVTFMESQENFEMDKDELLKLIQDNPGLFNETITKQVSEANGKQLELIEAQIRQTLGIEAGVNIGKALTEARAAQNELAQIKRADAVNKAITEATKELPYGEGLNKAFVEAVQAADFQDAAAVGPFVTAKRKEYDAIAAAAKVESMGYRGGSFGSAAPVFEKETGLAETLRPFYEITEAMAVRGQATKRDLSQATTKSALFTKAYLESFDHVYKRQLREELAQYKAWQEAEQVSDLNLPYAISRAIIAEAVPELVAVSVFDFGLSETSPTRVYYEAYAAESGATATVSAETIVGDHGAWVASANSRFQPGTVTLTNAAASVTYTEYTDYLIDYANGSLYTLAAGATTDAQSLRITYDYDVVRKGELAAIQRGKGTLAYATIELAADRLATQISDEAIIFASTQLGWDAVSRTVAMLIREVREMIDVGVMRAAIAQAHIAANTGGTWTSASDALSVLVTKMGTAKVAVQNDNYEPQSWLMSLTNADRLENYMITTTGTLSAVIQSNSGVLGAGDTGIRIKGLPVFASKNMPDTRILVVHPEAVQQRVLAARPMMLKGPYPSYSSSNLAAGEQYYVEEYSKTVVLTQNQNKAGYVIVA